jgi:hypothetical protein
VSEYWLPAKTACKAAAIIHYVPSSPKDRYPV